jgi:hypothetical protein
MLFRHARVCVAKLFGNNSHWHSAHCERGTVSVTKHVE